MFRRYRNIRALAFLCALAAAAGDVAAQPANLGPIPQRSALSDSDRRQITNFVNGWADQLADAQSSPAQTAQAAQQLMDPAQLTTATTIFLSEYSREVIPRLVKILEGDDTFKAVQAARVMGFLGTPDALEELLRWCNSASEDRESVRLWATRGCQILITRTLSENVLNERDLSSALRQIKQAAEDEDNWLVLHRQFEALAAAGTNAAREHQVEVFESVIRRIERGDDIPSQLMQALTRAMTSFRDQFIHLSRQQQDQFGPAVAPLLGKVYEVANAHWENAQQQAKAKESYGQAIQISESLLRFIDQTLRAGVSSPRTNLHGAWATGDRPRFETDTRTWMNVLQSPPYSP